MAEETKPPVPPRPEPPPRSRLTAEQLAKAQQWLRTRWPNGNCPFHGPTQWQVGDILVQTMIYAEGGGIILGGGPVYPLLLITCTQCGYTVFVNAIVAGVIAQDTASPNTGSTPAEDS